MRGPIGPTGERGLPGPRGRSGNVRRYYALNRKESFSLKHNSLEYISITENVKLFYSTYSKGR